VGIETSNLYTAFVALTALLLEPGGELVAITPRSFCNGRYFRTFRQLLLREMRLTRLHVFESRHQAFREDEVLQENVILRAVRQAEPGLRGPVTVSSSAGPDDDVPLMQETPYDAVVRPNDPECFIHITPDELGQQVVNQFAALTCS